MPFSDSSLAAFTQELASAAPAPGGGSAAAFAGALGASLVAMVCQLTIGRKNYQNVSAQFETMLPRAQALRAELLDAIQDDADAYTQVMNAYQLPKETDAEKSVRTRAIQNALKHAAEIPLRVAKACAEIFEMAQVAAAHGNKNAASDAGAGALMSEAGLRAALLNVEINLGLIQDEAFIQNTRAQLEPLKHIAAKRQSVLDTVQARI